jgi:hypothetical protein
VYTPIPSHPLLDRLWARYVADVPYARTLARLHDGPFENDHIALRSLAPGGIDLFARVFEGLGWQRAGAYAFPDMHLRAIHVSQAGLPRIFVSELDATQLPAGARATLEEMVQNDAAPAGDDADALAAWFRAPARAPSAEKLDEVAKVSHYGAWLLAFGRKVNHFTASVDDVELWQRKLKDAGVPMKSEIEGERGGPLRQTATHAAALDVALADGSVRALPYAYVEIAQRAAGFDGFLAPQARQLFDMTSTKGARDQR